MFSVGIPMQNMQDLENAPETLRMKNETLMETNRILMENNQILLHEVEVWKSNYSQSGKCMKTVMENTELKTINRDFFREMNEWKARCKEAEDKCQELESQLEILENEKKESEKKSVETQEKPPVVPSDLKSLMYFNQMESWKNRCQTVEEERNFLVNQVQVAQKNEKTLREYLSLEADQDYEKAIKEKKQLDPSVRMRIFLDQDVDVWRNYTYELRKQLDEEKRNHQRTKRKLRNAGRDESDNEVEIVETCEEASNGPSPNSKKRKIVTTSQSGPKSSH